MADSESKYQFLSNPKVSLDVAASHPAESKPAPFPDSPFNDSIGANTMNIALIGPDSVSRTAASNALRQCQGAVIRDYNNYPAGLDDVPRLLDQNHDVIIIDLDTNPEYALELVESICANGSETVMVYSGKADPEQLVRCMRAGAREFL